MKLTIKDLEGDFLEVIQRIIADNNLIVMDDNLGCQTRMEPTYVYIPELNLDIHSAFTFIMDNKKGNYYLDSDLYIFFNHETSEEMYYECGSSISVCIYNFLHFLGLAEKTIDEIEQLECIYIIDTGDVEKKKSSKIRKSKQEEIPEDGFEDLFAKNIAFDDWELLHR